MKPVSSIEDDEQSVLEVMNDSRKYYMEEYHLGLIFKKAPPR